jgi:hypothetical protein
MFSCSQTHLRRCDRCFIKPPVTEPLNRPVEGFTSNLSKLPTGLLLFLSRIFSGSGEKGNDMGKSRSSTSYATGSSFSSATCTGGIMTKLSRRPAIPAITGAPAQKGTDQMMPP